MIQIIGISDLNSYASGFVNFSMQVPAFEQNQLEISEIEFARSIQKNQGKNKFVKNNIEILSNPS